MRVRLILIVASAMCVATISASAQRQLQSESGGQSANSRQTSQVNGQDHDFLNYAAEDNQAEIQLCLLAEKKAQQPAVKAFARLMVDDHVGIESRLAALINRESTDVPNGMGKEGTNTFRKLEPQTKDQFDASFLKAQVKDHSHDIKRFTSEKDTTQNAQIRRFASETIPILQQHLALAQAIKKSIGQGAMASRIDQ